MPTLADRLRHIMTQKDVKAADIARATGVQPGVLSRYISGKVVPSSENLLTISQYFGVTPSWLLNGSDALESPQPVYNISTKDKVIKAQDKLIDIYIVLCSVFLIKLITVAIISFKFVTKITPTFCYLK